MACMTLHPSPRSRHSRPTLRLWVVELVVWLAEALGDGPLGAALKRWTMAQLGRAERGAGAIAVLAAMALLPAPPPALGPRRHRRPASAPRGFARAAVRGNDMRRMTSHLFPRERDVLVRARRLGGFLDALDLRARRLARRIVRVLPATRLVAIAPPAARCLACAAPRAPQACDTS